MFIILHHRDTGLYCRVNINHIVCYRKQSNDEEYSFVYLSTPISIMSLEENNHIWVEETVEEIDNLIAGCKPLPESDY